MINHRFCIAYPDNGTVSVPFFESHIALVFHELLKTKEECLLGSRTQATSCHVPLNRNSICEFFLNKSTDDFLIMIDTDISFQPNILESFNILINEYGVDKNIHFWDRDFYPHIIAGCVNIGNGLPVFFQKFEDGVYKQDPRPFTGLKKFSAVGTGIICLSRYCLTTLVNENKVGYHLFSHRSEGGKLASDDFSFLFLARQHGFSPFGSWDVKGLHYKTLPIQSRYLETEVEFNDYMKNNPDKIPDWIKELEGK